jgi:hypothetical protein
LDLKSVWHVACDVEVLSFVCLSLSAASEIYDFEQLLALISMATSSLPISQLESLRFKANQIIDSIQALQRTIEAGHQPAMPAWPDILSKYNLLLSQTHSFSTGLMGIPSLQVSGSGRVNPFEKIALHPNVAMSDTQLDGEVIPLLRNQQTLDVLKMENETVRRLAEHMVTKGSIGVLNGVNAPRDKTASGYGYANGIGAGKKQVEYEDVLAECEEIRSAHDRRVERAVRAVTMLRDKFEWKQRVEVEVEEPEELEWDPRLGMRQTNINDRVHEGTNGGDEEMGGDNGDGEGDAGMSSPEGGSSDENEVEGALVDSVMDSTHSPTSPTVLMSPPGASSSSPDVIMSTSAPI